MASARLNLVLDMPAGLDFPEASPILPKRRRLASDIPFENGSLSTSSVSSACESPTLTFNSTCRFFDDSWNDSSNLSSAGESPSLRRRLPTKKRIKTDALWKAIEPAYQYLMDEEIMETCKSTESDLSWDEEDLAINTNVTLAEFMQQYKELTDWLLQIQVVTQRPGMSLSERYLNQSYHEEMLQRSPRRKLFNDYAKQLLRRYPNMKDEITLRLQHLSQQWEELECAIGPHANMDSECAVKDLEADLNSLRKWLFEKEALLVPHVINPHWTLEEIEKKLREHQFLQRDIESHSKIVSAVLKLCERLQSENATSTSGSKATDLQVVAQNLERRWHGVWLQSLEWQCRLEDAISQIKAGSPLFGSSAANWDDLLDHQEFEEFDTFDETFCDDVIPFDEDEYEKISSDVDGLNQHRRGIPIPIIKSRQDHGQNVLEKNTPDTGFEELNAARTAGLSSDNLADQAIMWQSADKIDGKNKIMVVAGGKVEINDVGYGSESLSNDEQDGKIGKKSLSPRSSPKLDRCPKRKSTGEFVQGNLSSPQNSPQNSPQSVPRTSNNENAMPSLVSVGVDATSLTWRHSVTSAYDSSSNCSEQALTTEHEDGVDSTYSRAPRPNTLHFQEEDISKTVRHLSASPDEKFYRVTTIESELADEKSFNSNAKKIFSDDKPENGEVFSSTPCSRSPLSITNRNELSQLEKPFFGLNGDSDNNANVADNHRHHPCTRIDIIMTEMEHLDNNFPSSVPRHRTLFSNLAYNEPEIRSSYTHQWMESSQSSWNDRAFVEQVEKEFVHATPKSTPKNGMRRLINQAESLVKETDQQHVKEVKLDHLKQRDANPSASGLNSFISTDGSLITDESFSCDASSELTDSDDEYSSACSDQDMSSHLLDLPKDSNHTLHSNASTVTLTSPNTCIGAGKIVLRRQQTDAQKKDRPNSMTDASQALKALDTSQFSISEGAIDNDLFGSVPMHNTSDAVANDLLLYKANTFGPAKNSTKMRRMKRSQSESERLTRSPNRRFSSEYKKEMTPSTNSSSERTVNAMGVESSTDKLDMADEDFGVELFENSSALPVLHLSAMDDIGESDECLNSTFESFSENAWDNYQDLPYQTLSEGATEEKLDDSHLQWDVSAIDDDLSSTGEWPRLKRSSVVKSEMMNGADSDSDLEDLHHVIEESRRQLQVTGSSLRKPRRGAMNTGLYIQPQKYAEIIATCDTNVRCLEQIRATLAETDHNDQFSEEDIISIQETLTQWQAFNALAIQRRNESEKLNGIYQQMVGMRSTVMSAEDTLTWSRFDDFMQLEYVLKCLQDSKLDMQNSNNKLTELEEELRIFCRKRQHINIKSFTEELAKLRYNALSIADRLAAKVSEWHSVLMMWYDYNETLSELQYALTKESDVLKCLEVTAEMVNLDAEGHTALLSDLEAMYHEFRFYEHKLHKIGLQSNSILEHCDDNQASQIRADVAKVISEFESLQKRCLEDIGKCCASQLEEPIVPEYGVFDCETMDVNDLRQRELSLSSKNSSATQTDIQFDVSELREDEQKRSSFIRKLMRWAIPLQVACVVLYGLLFLSERARNGYGFTITPNLRYVRGPPPV